MGEKSNSEFSLSPEDQAKLNALGLPKNEYEEAMNILKTGGIVPGGTPENQILWNFNSEAAKLEAQAKARKARQAAKEAKGPSALEKKLRQILFGGKKE